MVISDPKGELYLRNKTKLENSGYTVRVVDLREPNLSDRWNPLDRAYEKYIRAHNLLKEVKVYNADGTFSDLTGEDEKIVDAIKDHFTIVDLTAKSSTGENQNYIEGDDTTVVTIQVKRKEYTISLEAGDYNVSTVSVVGAITNPAFPGRYCSSSSMAQTKPTSLTKSNPGAMSHNLL